MTKNAVHHALILYWTTLTVTIIIPTYVVVWAEGEVYDVSLSEKTARQV